jgi:hypothetical protein
MTAIDASAGADAALRFASLTLPDDAPLLRPAAALAPLLQTMLADAGSAEQGKAPLFVGSRADDAVLLAPWLAQSFHLPIRLGEKVLFSLKLPSIRLTPVAQDGISDADSGGALLSYLRRAMPAHAVVLTDVSTATALYAAVSRAAEIGYMVVRNEPDTHLFHRFRADHAAFFAELSSKYRNQLRKKKKVFDERFGDAYTLREYRRADEVRDFLEAASAINKKTYQYRMFGEAVDADPDSVAAAQRAADTGAFRSFILWHGDVPLCFILGHQRADGTFEHRQTGYDPAWRDFAPGIVCNMLLFEALYASADRPAMLDFGSGDSDYKRLFSNESRVTANPVLIPRRARYRATVWLFATSVSANDAAIGLLEKLGVKEWLKRRLRQPD